MSDKPERLYETPKVLHDAPLRKGDPSHFHFDDFAATLARLIASPSTRTPLTIGVSGPWGSGKTTLLARVRELLFDAGDLSEPSEIAFQNTHRERFRRCHTVWFDAWKYSGEDQVLAALLRVVVAEMQASGFWETVKAAFVAPKNEEVDWLGCLLDAVARFAGAGDYGIEKISQYRVDTPLKAASAFLDYFGESMNRLLASWVGGQLGASGPIDEREKVKTFVNDLNLQWAMLRNSGEAEGIDRGDFTRWQVLMRVAPPGFVRQMSDIDDAELRHGFVQDALKWGRGEEAVAGKFKEYEGSTRLKRVLRQITFSAGFGAQSLNAFFRNRSQPGID